MIICTGKPTGVLRTARRYENFELQLDWRHMKKKGNAGLFLWSDPLTAKGQPFTRSVEVQILDGRNTKGYTSHGDVFPIHGAKMTPDRPHPGGSMRCLPNERRSKNSPNWNHYHVTCKDGSLKLAVNGKVVSGGSKISPREGFICLESEGSEVHFRNLRIRELPASSSALPTQDVAAQVRGFRSLYTGTDLAGWVDHAGRPAQARKRGWQVRDWRLFDSGKTKGREGMIFTKASFNDFAFQIDFRRRNKNENASLELPADARARCLISLCAVSDTVWHRLELRLVAGELSASLDGKPYASTGIWVGLVAGPIGLTGGGQAVEFANIYVRSLR